MRERIIGLTGQTGAGKTTVCRVLRAAGFAVIDCDLLSREVTRAGTPCLNELAAHFGAGILLPNGALNRKALGAAAFADEASLQALNAMIHPYITAELKRRIKALEQGHTNGIVLDAPTLFESGVDALCGEIISVVAPRELRRARIMARDGLTGEQADARIAAQQEDMFYTMRSRYIIRNAGTARELRTQAQKLARALLAAKPGQRRMKGGARA